MSDITEGSNWNMEIHMVKTDSREMKPLGLKWDTIPQICFSFLKNPDFIPRVYVPFWVYFAFEVIYVDTDGKLYSTELK